MLDGSNPPAFEALTKEWTEKSPLFFTINDLGWDKCKIERERERKKKFDFDSFLDHLQKISFKKLQFAFVI